MVLLVAIGPLQAVNTRPYGADGCNSDCVRLNNNTFRMISNAPIGLGLQ